MQDKMQNTMSNTFQQLIAKIVLKPTFDVNQTVIGFVVL
jgi:hypothetical protein